VALVPAVSVSVLPNRSTGSRVSWHSSTAHRRSTRTGTSRAQRQPGTSASDDGRSHSTVGDTFFFASRGGAGAARSGSAIEAWDRHRDRASSDAATEQRYIDVGPFSWTFPQASTNITVVERFRMDAELRLVGIVAGLGRQSQSIDALAGIEQRRLLERSA
jgi:hypothetical protein